MSRPIFIMLDTETTSLNLRTGLPWEIGMVVFDSNYVHLADWCQSSPVPESCWDAGTLDWACNTYGREVVADRACVYGGSALKTGSAWVNYSNFIIQFTNTLKMLVAAHGKENVYLICNHVEFDWSMLLNAQAKAGIAKDSVEKIIHYRNKLDLQSLCIGSACARGYSYDAMYKDFKAYMASRGKDKVAHRAVEDCSSQIEMLRFFFDSLDALAN